MHFIFAVVANFLVYVTAGIGIALEFGSPDNRTKYLLMSPVIGAAICTILLLTSNVLGAPISAIAPAIIVTLAIFSAIKLGPYFHRRDYLFMIPVSVVFIFALSIVGYPGIKYGLDWVSVTNGDFLNYALSTKYFQDHAFYQIPASFNSIKTFEHSDVSAYNWTLYSILGERAGFNELLAAISSILRIDTIRTYMVADVTLTILLVLSVATASLRLGMGTAILAAFTTILSYATIHSSYHQLAPQMLGLSFNVCFVVICADMLGTDISKSVKVRLIALSSLLLAALLVSYSETMLALVTGLSLSAGIKIARRRAGLVPTILSLLAAALGALVLSAVFLPNVLQKYSHALIVPIVDPSYFYFLVPSGLANFWGIVPLNVIPPDPMVSVAISIGGSLLIGTSVVVILLASRGNPFACMVLVYFALLIYLFNARAQFALYKAVLYVQPFLICFVVESCAELRGPVFTRHRRAIATFALMTMIIVGAPSFLKEWLEQATQQNSVDEVPGATKYAFLDQLESIGRSSRTPVLVSSSNVGIFWYAAFYTHGQAVLFPTSPRIGILDETYYPAAIRNAYNLSIRQQVKAMTRAEALYFPRRSIWIPNGTGGGGRYASFDTNGGQLEHAVGDYSVLESGRHISVLNKGHFNSDFALIPRKRLSNQLLFINSSVGIVFGHRVESQLIPVALYAPEPDYFFPSDVISGAGRYLLFEVLRPAGRLQLRLDFTESLNPVAYTTLPTLRIIAKAVVKIPLRGRGAARLLSPAFDPLLLNGHSYFILDMGREPFRFIRQRDGLMSLYGRDVLVDTKQVSGFIRAVSVETAGATRPAVVPRRVASFPSGLAATDLLYSGCYESGWLSKHVEFVLRGRSGQSLKLVGLVPGFRPGYFVRMRVRVDGIIKFDRKMEAGLFNLAIARAGANGTSVVKLDFDREHSLSAADPKPASIQLKSIGFE